MLAACGGSESNPTTQAPQDTGAFSQQTNPGQQATDSVQVQPTATPELLPTATDAPTSTPRPTATTQPTATPQPVEAGVSRSNPLPIGSEFVGDTWSIIVTDVVRGDEATEAIASANQFNDPPRQGFEYLIANVRLENISAADKAESAAIAVDLRVTGDRNVVYNRVSVVPPKSLEGELFPGGAAEGQIVFEVPDDEGNLMFVVGEMLSFDSEAVRFVAIDPDATITPDPVLQEIQPTDLGKRRDNPARIGDTLVAGPWEFAVVEVVRGDDAAEMVQQANMFNDPAPDGQEYVLVKLRARFLGTGDPDRGENISGFFLKMTGDNSVVYESPSVVSPKPELDATLFAGGETEGWEVLSASMGEQGLKVIFQPLLSFSSDGIRYISIE